MKHNHFFLWLKFCNFIGLWRADPNGQSLAQSYELIAENGRLYFKQETDIFGSICEELTFNQGWWQMTCQANDFSLRLKQAGTAMTSQIMFHEQQVWLESMLSVRDVRKKKQVLFLFKKDCFLLFSFH